MKFIKGMIMGTAIVAGGMMLYNEMPNVTKRKMMKKGKQFIKKMGMI